MKDLVTLFLTVFVGASVCIPEEAQAQVVPLPLIPAETIDLAGPRVGMTFLSPGGTCL